MSDIQHHDVLVIGSGPAGQKAAIQAAKTGKKVLIIDRVRQVGGACVHRGTIPSKTLRETAVYLSGLHARAPAVFGREIPKDVALVSLMSRMHDVVSAHTRFIAEQLRRNGIEFWHGRARFVSPNRLEVIDPRGAVRRAEGEIICIATGSRPRTPANGPVDHENILDSDSILSLSWVPRSLTVLGSGVIAAEYASIFAALGVQVTMIDKYPLPIGFLDSDLTKRFVQHFESYPGCRFLGGRAVESVVWDGVSMVVTGLDGGEEVRSEKLLCALGRIANLEGLDLEAAGLAPTERGLLAVDESFRTATPHVLAVGDVIGPPSLASASMEQGRRAMRGALGLPLGHSAETIPAGIYTVPEIASVGLTEAGAEERHGACLVGRADFAELARGQIGANTEGMLKLVVDPESERILGAHIIGEGATELIHIGQVAMIAGWQVEALVESIFNFPTLAEAYRVAALDVLRQRRPALVS